MTTTRLLADDGRLSDSDTGSDASRRSSTADATAVKLPPARDSFLDVLRAIALARVIVWHTFGLAILSWIVATMPIMFFVAGTLLYRSLDGRDAGAVLRKRLRRLLVPYWFFGATVLGFLSLLHIVRASAETRLQPGQLLAWFVPLTNPTASAWEAGWASAPLWYLRCYLWILLLSPLLLRGWKRWGYGLLGLPIIGLVSTQIVADRMAPGPNHPLWIIGDLALYSVFVLLGFAHAQGRLAEFEVRDLVEWVLIGAAGAAVAWQIFPSADGVANHSYPTLACLGIGWLAGLALLRPWLSRVDEINVLGSIVRWTTSRAMSIYLWHSPMIVLSYTLVATVAAEPSPFVLLSIVVGGVVVVSTATGWIEDVAGGRPAQLWPGRPILSPSSSLSIGLRSQMLRPLLAGSVAATIVLGLLVRPGLGDAASSVVVVPDSARESSLGLPPAPSGRPAANAFGLLDSEVTTSNLVSADDGLLALVEQWREEHGVAGVRVGVSLANGERRTAVSGTDEDGSPIGVDDVVPITSITKTMTAALVLQLLDQGLLELDQPIPGLDAVPDFAHSGAFTYRQLLQHSSGLAPYQESVGYDQRVGLDPVKAIRLAGATELQWQPGTVGGYSNSGFLTLGRLIEQLSGAPYDEMLRIRIIEPLGLTRTSIDSTPVGGWVGDSAGGVVSTVDDLLTWGDALYRTGSVISPDALAEMTRIDPDLASGLGTFPVCPCDEVDGSLRPTSIGHNGGSVTLQYAPADGTVVVASFTESFWTSDLAEGDVYELLAAIRASFGS